MTRPNDERNEAITPTPALPPRLALAQRGLRFKLAALGLTLVSALAGTGLAYWLKAPDAEPARPAAQADGKGIPPRLFKNWGKPDLVVVLSAQQHGYIQPCGCSYPQVGGLERRYTFLQLLKQRGWPVVAVDLGDIAQNHGPAKLPNVQGLIKYRYSMKALKEMGYLAVGVGAYESALSLGRVEGEWAASFPQPAVLAANLKGAGDNFPFIKPFETQTVPGTNIRVGVTNIVGPDVGETIKDASVKFNDSAASLRQQLQKFQADKVDLPILLYHGTATGQRKEASACAKAFPQFPIVVALSEEDEPPGWPDEVKHANGISNYVFRLGHKGKYIGVLGVYRNGGNFSFKYELVKMSIDYETPEEQKDNHPIMKLMEEYTRELKKNDFLKEYGQSKHLLQAMNPVPGLQNPGDGIPKYIGSEACGKCHEHAYNIWKASKHSHAYQTLVDAKHPSLRQFDGECIVCHTVGFGYKTGFTNEKDTPRLENVGCESCHGPGSLHKANPKNQEWRDRMNQPWLDARKKGNAQAKNHAIENVCISCHDMENDVTWTHDPNNKKDPFIEKWIKRKILHNEDTPEK
jgi:hypothetical protein